MRLVGQRLVGILGMALVLGCGDGDGAGAATKQVLVVDPAGGVEAGSKGDLSALSIVQMGDGLEIAVRIAPGEFELAASYAVVVIDVDMDPLTGDAPGPDGSGGDYLVEMGSACLQGKAVLRRYDGARGQFGPVVGQYDVTYRADGIATTVPVAALDGYTGGFFVRIESAREIEGCGYTELPDSMPDAGKPPAVFR
jgi:hypothetical protein